MKYTNDEYLFQKENINGCGLLKNNGYITGDFGNFKDGLRQGKGFLYENDQKCIAIYLNYQMLVKEKFSDDCQIF